MMDRYKIIKHVGSGTFGCVFQAVHKESGRIVAIKKIQEKYQSWHDSYDTEVRSLAKLGDHPNIIKLEEAIRDTWDNTLYLVFEYMDYNLHQIIQKNVHRDETYDEDHIKKWCFQILRGLDYMHRGGYFHRDLKPGNLLVSRERDTIKIADLGSIREIKSQTPLTDYVTTRRYRAPEVLLGSRNYDPAVDMWAMGAIVAELFMGRAIFPGISSGADQLYKICCVIGSPKDWKEGFELANAMNYQIPQTEAVSIASVMSTASEDAISLFKLLCSWDPSKRPTAGEALQHPFFHSCYHFSRFINLSLQYNVLLPAPKVKADNLSRQDSDILVSSKPETHVCLQKQKYHPSFGLTQAPESQPTGKMKSSKLRSQDIGTTIHWEDEEWKEHKTTLSSLQPPPGFPPLMKHCFAPPSGFLPQRQFSFAPPPGFPPPRPFSFTPPPGSPPISRRMVHNLDAQVLDDLLSLNISL